MSTKQLRMSPVHFAQDECVNLEPDGHCLGVKPQDLVDNGQYKTATPKDHCLLIDGQPCDYFEQFVLPLADNPSPKENPNLQTKRAAAREEYQYLHLLKTRNPKTCPDCNGPLPKRCKYCEKCAAKRARKSQRQNRTKTKSSTQDLTTP